MQKILCDKSFPTIKKYREIRSAKCIQLSSGIKEKKNLNERRTYIKGIREQAPNFQLQLRHLINRYAGSFGPSTRERYKHILNY